MARLEGMEEELEALAFLLLPPARRRGGTGSDAGESVVDGG